jgi:hypothetical protein
MKKIIYIILSGTPACYSFIGTGQVVKGLSKSNAATC